MKGLKIGKALAVATLMVLGTGSGAAKAAPAGPEVAAQGALHLTLPAVDASIVSVVLDFAPGAGVPEHTHGGPLVVTVLSGAITLYEDGGTETYKAGESWTEMPGHKHSAFNRTNANTRVGVSALLTKDAELQTLTDEGTKQKEVVGPTVTYQAAYPITIPAEEADLVGLALDFAPGTGVPNHVHGGPLIVQVLSGQITLTEDNGTEAYKAGETWTETSGHVHNAFNEGTVPTQVLVSALIPKGAQLQTILDQPGSTPSGMPRTGGGEQNWAIWLALLSSAIVLGGGIARMRRAE